MKLMDQLRVVFWLVVPIAAFCVVWELAVQPQTRLAFLFSRPSEIGAAFSRLVHSPAYWADFAATSYTLTLGYAIGIVAAFFTGLVVWFSGRSARIAEAYLIALGAIPIFALAPLLIFAFGIGFNTRLIVVVLSVWIPVSLAVYSSAKEVHSRYGEFIRASRLSQGTALKHIITPGVFYLSLPAMRAAVNTALVGAFVSEWISAERGLAKSVLAAMSIYNVPAMWVGLITFIAVSAGFSWLVYRLEVSLTRWRREFVTN